MQPGYVLHAHTAVDFDVGVRCNHCMCAVHSALAGEDSLCFEGSVEQPLLLLLQLLQSGAQLDALKLRLLQPEQGQAGSSGISDRGKYNISASKWMYYACASHLYSVAL